jgi:uncharacterized protein (TIGR03067 family)
MARYCGRDAFEEHPVRAVLLFTCLAIAVPDRQAPAPRKQESKSLHDEMLGEWQMVTLNLGDGVLPAAPPNEVRTLRFGPNEIQTLVNGVVRAEETATYKLDLSKQPVTIDLSPRQKADNKEVQGIVKVEGDQLTLCFAIMGDRPTEFAATNKGLHALMQLKRVRR